jgi:EpsI family protein
LLALGVIFVYFSEKSRWKQIALVVSTIPIAILTNALRIAGTGFLAQKFSLQLADSFFHSFSGWLLFLFALVLLFVGYKMLSYIQPPKAPNRHNPINSDRNSVKNTHNRINVAMIICSIFLIITGFLGYSTLALPPLKIDKGLTNFPLQFHGWKGRTENIDSKIIALSGAEDAFNGIFKSQTGDIISLYIGYRGSPFVESENFFHSPNVCLPSLGWKTLTISNHEIPGVPGFDNIIVRRMLIEKMGYRQLVYYWFQTKNRVSSNVNVNRLHLMYHALQKDNTHDLFIRPMTLLKPNETEEDAGDRLDQFVRDVTGILIDFLASNQVVSRQ